MHTRVLHSAVCNIACCIRTSSTNVRDLVNFFHRDSIVSYVVVSHFVVRHLPILSCPCSVLVLLCQTMCVLSCQVLSCLVLLCLVWTKAVAYRPTKFCCTYFSIRCRFVKSGCYVPCLSLLCLSFLKSHLVHRHRLCHCKEKMFSSVV